MLARLAPRLILANLIAQSAIIVTGAVVRVTGSGLGCPTWPECAPGSFTPTMHQAEGWHKYVEFGNRTLTFVLGAIAILLVLAVWRATTDRGLRRLAVVPIIGTLAQGVLGGITVLMDLHSLTVMAHLLVSVAIVAFAVRLRVQFEQPYWQKSPRLAQVIGQAVQHTALAVVVLGSVVTASGPHSGDADVASVLPVDPRVTAWLHADVVWLFLGLIAASWLLRAAGVLPRAADSALRALTGISLAQGALGYLQYFTGLPSGLVALHVAGATSVWVAACTYALRARRIPATATS